jgi:hypothetical protein
MSAVRDVSAEYTADCIECDNCGDKTRAWDWSPHYDRFCLECLDGLEDADPRADRGDFECHQRADR